MVFFTKENRIIFARYKDTNVIFKMCKANKKKERKEKNWISKKDIFVERLTLLVQKYQHIYWLVVYEKLMEIFSLNKWEVKRMENKSIDKQCSNFNWITFDFWLLFLKNVKRQTDNRVLDISLKIKEMGRSQLKCFYRSVSSKFTWF